ncbi:MAG TPA: hypothetical protein VIR30_10745 [Nocardioides sp.]|uniref:hypothetical protein n=1 Tax=Nocardioides alcanivorans TaxID=2897352 RepID=UPI001F19577E|nr:hypothetical protein [Nocardioides alcanivorans]
MIAMPRVPSMLPVAAMFGVWAVTHMFEATMPTVRVFGGCLAVGAGVVVIGIAARCGPPGVRTGAVAVLVRRAHG